MRISFILFVLGSCIGILASSFRRVAEEYPTCVYPCLGVAPHGDCAFTDNACLCKDKEYVVGTTECIRQACSDPNDVQSAIDLAISLCRDAGINLLTLSTDARASTAVPSAVATAGTISSSCGETSGAIFSAIFGAAGVCAAILLTY